MLDLDEGVVKIIDAYGNAVSTKAIAYGTTKYNSVEEFRAAVNTMRIIFQSSTTITVGIDNVILAEGNIFN